MQIKGIHFKIKKLFLGTIWIERSFEDAKVNSIDETANITLVVHSIRRAIFSDSRKIGLRHILSI